MSAYITLATPMLDEECLVAAIVDLGFDETLLVRSNEPISLRGWQSGQRANIVLRREHTGDAYNDVGFLRRQTGFTAILSNDHARYGQAWLAKISERYQVHQSAKQSRLAAEQRQRIDEEHRQIVELQRQMVHERARKLGYRVEEKREGDTLRLILVKRTY